MTDGARPNATRERLLTASMDLFAQRGYTRTTVGEIEQAAGLAPRSGALYQYFASKQDLLHAAVEHQLRAIDELPSVMDLLPLGDLRSELLLLGRWNLASLDRRAALAQFLRREGDQLPDNLRAQLFDRLVTQPYDLITAWLNARAERAGAPPLDGHALTLILIEPMAAHRAMQATFGRTPDDIDDERLLRVWLEVCLAYAQAVGLS